MFSDREEEQKMEKEAGKTGQVQVEHEEAFTECGETSKMALLADLDRAYAAVLAAFKAETPKISVEDLFWPSRDSAIFLCVRVAGLSLGQWYLPASLRTAVTKTRLSLSSVPLHVPPPSVQSFTSQPRPSLTPLSAPNRAICLQLRFVIRIANH